jgi:cytochrome d ubiquinol oxidase subunit I
VLLDALPLAESSNLLAAREQMAFTLGFHIVLSCIGVALPATMMVANYVGLKRDDRDAMELARRWSKAMAVTFAVGAVTGTVLSFEFGLLWPQFEHRFGSVFGIAFAIEGIFFFVGRSSSRSTSTAGSGSAPGPTSGPGCRWSSPGSAAPSPSSPPTPG